MNRPTKRNIAPRALLACIAALAGLPLACAREKAPADPAARDAAIEATLTSADAFDGAADHTIAKCPACALGMDGSDAHALKFKDYTLHFCSSGCKSDFEKDTAGSILALKVPEK